MIKYFNFLVFNFAFAFSSIAQKTYFVTNVLDMGTGSLSSVISNANNGDTIKFKLSYPANIKTRGYWINKNLVIIGPANGIVSISFDVADHFNNEFFRINSNYSLTLRNLTLSGKGSSNSFGSSAITNHGKLEIISCTIMNCVDSSGQGGAIYNSWDANLYIKNSTFSSNYASQGGAIYSTGNLEIISSTFCNNYASNVGGGIFWHANGGYFKSRNSLYYESSCYKYDRIINSSGYNMSNDNTYQFTNKEDYNQINNILLGNLQFNGGPTMTHALLDCSSALDAGDPTILDFDQRGQPVNGGRKDIGAYERQGLYLIPPLIILTQTKSSICYGDSVNLTVSGAEFFNWNPADGLSLISSNFVVAKPNKSVTYTVKGTNANGCSSFASATIRVNQCRINLNLKLFLQGYYQNPNSANPMDNGGNGGCLFVTKKSTNPSDVDTVKVTLVNSTLNEVASAKGILKTNGSLAVSFDANASLVLGNQYYLKINHRNSIETWSAEHVILNAVTN